MMFILIGIIIISSAFFLGRYTSQIHSEKINDTNKSILVGVCDTVLESNWLSAEQKSKLADAMIDKMPVKDQRIIREKTDAFMKMFKLLIASCSKDGFNIRVNGQDYHLRIEEIKK